MGNRQFRFHFTLPILAVSLLGQTAVPVAQVPWTQVDWSSCGGPGDGTRIKLSQIRRPAEIPDTPCWAADLGRAGRSIINTRCTRCHGNDLRPGDVSGVGGLDLRTRAGLAKGGSRGSAIPLIAWFVAARTAEQNSADPGEVPLSMPPFWTLPASEIETIRLWSLAGFPEVQ